MVLRMLIVQILAQDQYSAINLKPVMAEKSAMAVRQSLNCVQPVMAVQSVMAR